MEIHLRILFIDLVKGQYVLYMEATLLIFNF